MFKRLVILYIIKLYAQINIYKQGVICRIFSVGLDYLLISRFSSESVLFCMSVLICLKQKLPLQATEFFFATLVIKKLAEDLLITFEIFT